MHLLIRPAMAADSEKLTKISFASKRYWGDPEEYFDVWKAELTITPSYISNNTVYVAEDEGQMIGYFALSEVKNDFQAGNVLVTAGHWLEHIFILPEYVGKGIGTQLMNHLRSLCKARSITRVRIFSDPHARGFYAKNGARYLGESPSSIKGRTVSLYEIYI